MVYLQLLDTFLVNLFFLNPSSTLLAKFFLFLSWGGEYGFFWIFILGLLLWRCDEIDGKVSFLRLFMSGMLVVLFISTFAKFAIARERPFLNDLQLWSESLRILGLEMKYPLGFAMPSFHAMSSFLAYVLISSRIKRWAREILLLALLISYSRLYLGVHYFSDVTIGAILGVLIAKIMLFLEKNKSKK